MTAQEQGLAWVAEPGWRWLPGMLARYGNGASWYRTSEGDGYPGRIRPPDPRQAIPDVTDPCTVGGLLALVREAQEAIESQARERPAPVEHVYWINMVRTALQFWLNDRDVIPLLDAWQHAPGHSRHQP